MKMVHIVIFWGFFKSLLVGFNTKHAMQHIYNYMYNTRFSTYTLFMSGICILYNRMSGICILYNRIEKEKQSRQQETGADFPGHLHFRGWSETTNTTKARKNSHDIFFQEVMSLARMSLDFSDQLAACHFQLEMFGSNKAVSRERFFMQINNFPNVPKIWNNSWV